MVSPTFNVVFGTSTVNSKSSFDQFVLGDKEQEQQQKKENVHITNIIDIFLIVIINSTP